LERPVSHGELRRRRVNPGRAKFGRVEAQDSSHSEAVLTGNATVIRDRSIVDAIPDIWTYGLQCPIGGPDSQIEFRNWDKSHPMANRRPMA
jgi:hypothetical protein